MKENTQVFLILSLNHLTHLMPYFPDSSIFLKVILFFFVAK